MTQLRRLAASNWHPLSGITYSTLILVLVWLSYQRFLNGQGDAHGCRALLNDGAWSPAHSSSPQKWEPTGCRMAEYQADAIHNCLNGQRLVLAGDSTIRQIFWAAAKKLDPEQAKAESADSSATNEKHHDLTFQAKGVRLEFIWDPWLNSTGLDDALKTFHVAPASTTQGALSKKDESAALIVLGSPGLWAAHYGGEDYLNIFKRGINGISAHLSSNLGDNTLSASSAKGVSNVAPNQILLAPVEVPAFNTLSSGRSETITSERIDKMNDFLSHLPPNQTSHVMWAFNQMTSSSGKAFGGDGLHVEDNIADRKIDVVLNSHCNAPAVDTDRLFQGTCCAPEPKNDVFKLALLLLGLITLLYVPRSRSIPKFTRQLPVVPEVITATRDVLIALIWCWICDGTLQVGKLERHYQQGPFVVSCLFWVIGSLAIIRKVLPSVSQAAWTLPKSNKEQPYTSDHDQGFLCRDQSEEIKGLMQGFILLYHYNYGSQALWVYKIVRVLISAYFFLSAYGHTQYMLKTGDYSLRRVAVVLFRINALSAVLPYMMGTSYSSYYFAPVITFWYLVIYTMLRVFKRWNSDPWILIMKALVAASLTSLLISTPGLLEAIANMMHSIFRMSWDAEEFRFRLGLDRYIVYVGIFIGSLVHSANMHDARERFKAPPSTTLDSDNVQFYVLATAGLGGFFYFTQTGLPTKQEYNELHPFISWIPIFGFLILRNLHPAARNAYLALPAKLGRIALETYILQYHIWLGGDATAKLTLGLDDARFGGWMIEKVLLTIIFIGISALTHRATAVFTGYITERGFLVLLAGLWIGNLVYG
ncbi:10 TM acyl transferase domain found in Cas1p-domain-containing protein [Biscogniauxia sp. FL1348]|nr:10 TM acyl transferase domain found in Cas1p-domain-containing protein [Biscogniauxia sp. FL1348]